MDEGNQTKLPFDEDDINALFDAEENKNTSKIKPFSQAPLKGVVMPSLTKTNHPVKQTNIIYHNLEDLYPNPNLANNEGFVIHRANLLGINGILQLFDWASDGDVSVVDLKDILLEESILSQIVTKLNEFVIDDLGGDILQVSKTRLLVLPPSCKGMKGLADEAFVN